MKKTKRIAAILMALVLTAVIGTVAVYAAGSVGTEDDPLVSLSYLTDVFTAKVTELFRTELTERETALREEYGSRISALESSVGITPPEDRDYTVETLQDGQTVVCQRGAEILLRIGDAKVSAADEPGLVDTSSTANLADGESLEKNHLYMVTINGNGIRAVGTVKVVLRGDYTIS